MDLDYQLLPRTIWQSLLSDDGFKTEVVGYNLELPGKLHHHHVDVYFEYIKKGVSYYIAIDCDSYNTALTVESVSGFDRKLTDLYYVSGIIVTKQPVTLAVKEFANINGINILEISNLLLQETATNNASKQKELPFAPIFIHDRRFHFDEQWLEQHGVVLSEEESSAFSRLGWTEQISIFDSKGNEFANLQIVEASLPADIPILNHQFYFDFDDAFIEFPHIGPIKLSSIEFNYDVLDITQSIIEEGDAVEAIVRDNIINGNIKLIHNPLIKFEIDRIHSDLSKFLFKGLYN